MQLLYTRHRRQRSFPRFPSLAIVALVCVSLVPEVPSAFQSPALLSVTLSPATIPGGSGDSSTATVTLSAPAPAGGVVVTLTSSNIELAATMGTVTVPQGSTTATFAVATNPSYRAYSNLAFNVTISATALGATRTATLNVTAQPRPADFTSGSQAGANTQWDGLMCGGVAPLGGQPGILYSCSPASGTGFGNCTFRQECSLGCRRVPPNGTTFNDFCSTGGPNPVAISRNLIVSGDRVAGTIVAEAPAGQAQDREQAVPGVIDLNFNASHFPISSFSFNVGATTAPFEVATSYVPRIQFVDVIGHWFNASIPPFLITNGRAGHAWLVMRPPNPAPVVALPTLGDFTMTGLNPVTGGNRTFGSVDLSGLSRVGGPTLTLTSSHPNIVAPTTVDSPASESLFGFQLFFDTTPPAADTDVTVTVSDGRYSFSDVVRVLKPAPAPVLSAISVSPASVVGGTSAIGTVTLSAAQSTAKVVQVSIIDGAPASLPSNTPPCPPSSRCHNVTVPAGATSASFVINTSPVTSQFNLNLFASLSGSPDRQALLLITAGGPNTVKTVTTDPAGIVGGRSSTGTVTLTAAAPAGGAVVTLSKAFSGTGTGTVPITIPASVTVPSGQTTASFAIGSSAVTATTSVRVSGSRNGITANTDMTLWPLLASVLFSGNVPGGTAAQGSVHLNGPAPAGGTSVALSSGNPSLATVPASVSIPAGQTTATFTANTSPVTQTTAVAITASTAGTTVTANLFLVVSRAVSAVTLTPSSLVGPGSSTGRVTLQSAAPNGNAVVALASSNTTLATVPFSVVVPSGQSSVTFTVNAAQVTSPWTVVISATYENVTRSATLTINPSGSSTPSAPTLASPANGATGVTQPVTLDWSDVTGATSYEVQIDNSSTIAAPLVANPTVTASQASMSGLPAQQLWWRVRARNASGVFGPFSAARQFTPQGAAGQTATLTVAATGRSGERVTSTPVGINVSVGSSGSASFTTGTSITLRVTNSRDAVWSGACSSGGNKTKTCTFTLNGNATVNANVQ